MFLKSTHHYLLDSAGLPLDKYARESFSDKSRGRSPASLGFLLFLPGLEFQYRRSELSDNPLSHSTFLCFFPLDDSAAWRIAAVSIGFDHDPRFSVIIILPLNHRAPYSDRNCKRSSNLCFIFSFLFAKYEINEPIFPTKIIKNLMRKHFVLLRYCKSEGQ